MATATSPFSFPFEVGGEEKKKRPALYEVLGCDQSSSAEQIQAEYRVRALRLHPDKAGEEGAEQFCKLQAAMSVLGDTRRRAQYDSWLASPLPLSFEDFSRNSATLSASTHWAPPPPSQGKITGFDTQSGIKTGFVTDSGIKTGFDTHSGIKPSYQGTSHPLPSEQPSLIREWRAGRPDTDVMRKFRNYEV